MGKSQRRREHCHLGGFSPPKAIGYLFILAGFLLTDSHKCNIIRVLFLPTEVNKHLTKKGSPIVINCDVVVSLLIN